MDIVTRRTPINLLILLLIAHKGIGQSKIPSYAQHGIGKFIYQTLHDTTSEESSRVLLFPTAGLSPETSLEAGVRAFSLFHARQDTGNRLSEIAMYGFVTLRGQFGGHVENAVYTANNTYYLLGQARYQQFPLLYYGIGSQASSRNPALVSSSYSQVRQRLLRKFRTNWYIGPEIDFQNMQNVTFEQNNLTVVDRPAGGYGSTTVELGVSLLFDNRKNVLNVRRGMYFEGTALRNTLYTDVFSYGRFVFDGRFYRPLGKHNRILALQTTGIVLTGDVPFNSLALLGGENTMRGYYLGRYRDKTMVAAQAEVRWLPFSFSSRWGGALFAGLGTVSPTVNQIQLNGIRWAMGGGIRFLFFQHKDVFIRADLGITREGTGVYLSLGEAF